MYLNQYQISNLIFREKKMNWNYCCTLAVLKKIGWLNNDVVRLFKVWNFSPKARFWRSASNSPSHIVDRKGGCDEMEDLMSFSFEKIRRGSRSFEVEQDWGISIISCLLLLSLASARCRKRFVARIYWSRFRFKAKAASPSFRRRECSRVWVNSSSKQIISCFLLVQKW